MKLILIESGFSVFIRNIASWFSDRNIIGIQLFVWLFVDDKEKWQNNKVDLNHENIHFRQGVELLFIGFWILYGLNYLINLAKFDKYKAYRSIVFEKEAYNNEKDLTYNKYYEWIKYL